LKGKKLSVKKRYKVLVLLLAIPVLLQASVAVAPTVKITSFWDNNTVPAYVDMGNFAWAEAAVNDLSKYGIINGYVVDGKNYFKANTLMDRAEFAKIVVSAFGAYDANSENSMLDNPSYWWAYKYIGSAVESGIAKGYSNEWFGAQDDILRQDVAVMLVKAIDNAGIVLPIKNSGVTFADADKISDYAKDAVNRLASAGIVQGDKNGFFYPQNNAERAEIAVMVDRIISN